MGLGYELESGAGALLLEDGTGVYLLEGQQVPRFAVTNLYAEMPPMSGWPEPNRSTGSLERLTTPSNSDYVLRTWDHANEKRHFPCKTKDSNPVQLFDDGGVQQSVTETTVSGWTSSYFNDPVDNNENLDWEIRHDGTVYADVRPWDGAFCLIYLEAGTSDGGVSYDVSDSNRHARAYTDGSNTSFGWAPNAPLPLGWADSNVLSGGDWVSVRWNRRAQSQECYLARESGGLVVLYRSTNGGRSFSVVSIVASGSKPSLVTFRHGGMVLYYRDGAGVLKGQRYGQNGSAVGSGFTAVAAVDDEGCAAYEVPGVNAGRTVALLYVSGGNVTRAVSTDGGQTFGAGTVVEAGVKPAACAGKDDRVLECWVSGTAIRGRTVGPRGDVTEAVTAWVASGVDDQQIAVGVSPGPAGQWRGVLLYVASGVLTQATSYDGVVWS